MNLRIIGISAALVSAASWAVGSILFKRLGEHLSPLALTLAKGTISIVLLAIAVLLTGYQDISREPLLLLILSGLLGITLGDTFFFAALQNIGPHALILLLTLGEVFTVILAVVFLGETPTPMTWGGIALVLTGVLIVLYAKISHDETSSSLRGIVLGLLSVFCMSVSLIVAKQGLADISAIQATFIRMLSGTTGIFFFGLVTQRVGLWINPLKDFHLMKRLIISVAVITFGGFWLSLVVIKYIDVSIADTLNSTEPLFVLPLAVIFLKEKVTLSAIVGTFITVIGIVLLCNV